jgi:predicted dehydrogenase
MRMLKLALIGAGQRGMIYGEAAQKSGLAKIVAVAEPNTFRRQAAARAFSIPPELVFDSEEGFFDAGKLADALIIASMDRDHYRQAMAAMDLKYHLLLEKPISPDPAECLRIAEKAGETGRIVTVCHVLRYAPFYRALKDIIGSGELGRVVSIVHNENVGNFHMAHSFVRGNWRNSGESSPIIMQKSCHDMDLLVWLTGSEADYVSSFGQLTYFKEENAPRGSTARCFDCPAAEGCRFDARKCYLPIAGNWPATALTLDQSEAGLNTAIAQGPYGRCVYRCDNNVCDHQIVNIQFKNGVTAAFSLSAFVSRISRTIKVMCEHGEIRGSDYDNRIEIIPFVSTGISGINARTVFPDQVPGGGHLGGDEGLMRDFLALLQSEGAGGATSITRSVESHLIACAAEASRLSHATVDMNAYRRELNCPAISPALSGS